MTYDDGWGEYKNIVDHFFQGACCPSAKVCYRQTACLGWHLCLATRESLLVVMSSFVLRCVQEHFSPLSIIKLVSIKRWIHLDYRIQRAAIKKSQLGFSSVSLFCSANCTNHSLVLAITCPSAEKCLVRWTKKAPAAEKKKKETLKWDRKEHGCHFDVMAENVLRIERSGSLERETCR